MESTAVERAERPESTDVEPAERPESTAVERAERPEGADVEPAQQQGRDAAADAGVEINLDAEQTQDPVSPATPSAISSSHSPSASPSASTSRSPAPAPPPDYDRDRALGIRVIAFVLVLCLLVASWAITHVSISSNSTSASGVGKGHRPVAALPPPHLTQHLPATFTIPGSVPAIPWPSVGQATIEMEGYGSLGSSGKVTTPVPIASVTKTMTAYLILQHHPLAAGDAGPTITISSADAAAYATAAKQGQSLVKVQAGERISERDALEALMLASADNIAKVLARWDTGSVSAFVDSMNAAARKLGMTHTTYTDPSGLDPSTVSTAPDQVLLGRAAMQSATFAAIVGEQSASVPVEGTIHNFNRLVGRNGVTGIKTGSTDQAGGCLLFADTITVGGRTQTVIGAVLGQPLGSGDAFLDRTLSVASKMISAAQDTVTAATVVTPGTLVASLSRKGWPSERPLGVAAPVVVVGRPGQTYRVSVSGGAVAPVLVITALNVTGSGSGSASASGPAVTGSLSVPLKPLLPRGAVPAW
jgi:D-alanyl-D-alanine carboxypeptidase (penicillin-binding protein 5/6)